MNQRQRHRPARRSLYGIKPPLGEPMTTTTNYTAHTINIIHKHYHAPTPEPVQKPIQKATGLLAFVTAALGLLTKGWTVL